MTKGEILGVITAIFLLLGAALFGELLWAKYLGPVREAIRTEIYEESRAHVTGTNTRLGALKLDYDLASPEHQQVLRAAILIEAAEFPSDKMTPQNREFIESLQRR